MKLRFSAVAGESWQYWGLLGGFALLVLLGLSASHYMESHGHVVTGMTNQIVWGMPHVFAVFLIVAASGALNVASIASVFGRTAYKPLARMSAVVAIALLAGGLMILVLDLGRPDRLIVAMTHYNFKSIFAWNIILYNGFFAIVAIYLWTMMDRTLQPFSKYAGFGAFIWRLILTTGTGSIFGFIVAREAFDAAILAPMFVVMSFAYGLAVFLLIILFACKATGRPLGDLIVQRMRHLLGLFVAGSLYFVITYHVTNLYASEHQGVEQFILLGVNGGEKMSGLFWLWQVIVGGLVPIALLLLPQLRGNRPVLIVAAVLVIIGGLSQMYVTIIGGQAYPLELLPGMDVHSSFNDGVAASYSATLREILLGTGGIGVALAAVTFAVKILPLMPDSLADEVVDPHHAQG